MCLPNIGQAVFFLTNSNGKKRKREPEVVTLLEDLPDVTHAHMMCAESITKQVSLQQDGDALTLTPGRTEVVWTVGSQGLSDTDLSFLGCEQERI